MRAVMFDLYCTLVPGSTSAQHADARRAMGKALRLDPPPRWDGERVPRLTDLPAVIGRPANPGSMVCDLGG